MTKKDLFIELAVPNENGYSRWVSVEEFVGKYQSLRLGNGGGWCRRDKQGALYNEYKIEVKYSEKSGNPISAIRTIGFQKEGFHE